MAAVLNSTRHIKYALGCWRALTRYCDNGLLEIESLPNGLGLVALIRKNLMFPGCYCGRECAAAIHDWTREETDGISLMAQRVHYWMNCKIPRAFCSETKQEHDRCCSFGGRREPLRRDIHSVIRKLVASEELRSEHRREIRLRRGGCKQGGSSQRNTSNS
jgi:hypothetical protein